MALPGLEWIYNSWTGEVVEVPSPVGYVELHSGLGWHGPFDSQQAANDYYTANKGANPGWKAPTGIPGILSNAGSTAAGAVTAPVTDVTSAITAATNTVTKWIPRILEAAVGVVLLAIAANAILKQATGVNVAGTAARTGRKVAGGAAKAAVVA